MRWRFWILWFIGNAIWLVGAPILFGLLVGYQVQSEHLSGARINTDGDSIGIPVAGFAVVNSIVTLVFNLAWGVYGLYKKWRSA